MADTVDDPNSTIEPAKPANPLAPAPLEQQSGKPSEVSDASAKLNAESASSRLPAPGASDATAQANRMKAEQCAGTSSAYSNRVGELVGRTATTDNGQVFVTNTGGTYNMEISADGLTATLTPAKGDAPAVSGPLQRAADPINASANKSNEALLSQADATKKFSDTPAPNFHLTDKDAPALGGSDVQAAKGAPTDAPGSSAALAASPGAGSLEGVAPLAPAPPGRGADAPVPVAAAPLAPAPPGRGADAPAPVAAAPLAPTPPGRGLEAPAPVAAAPLAPAPPGRGADVPVPVAAAPLAPAPPGRGLEAPAPVAAAPLVPAPPGRGLEAPAPVAAAPLAPAAPGEIKPVVKQADGTQAAPSGDKVQTPLTPVNQAPLGAPGNSTVGRVDADPLKPSPPTDASALPFPPTGAAKDQPTISSVKSNTPDVSAGNPAPLATKPDAGSVSPGADKPVISGVIKPVPTDAGSAVPVPPGQQKVGDVTATSGAVPQVGDPKNSAKPVDTAVGAQPVAPPPLDGLKKDAAPKAGQDGSLSPVDKAPNPNQNTLSNAPGAPNSNAPTLDKSGDPTKIKAIDTSAADALARPAGAASGAKGFGDGGGTLDKQAEAGQTKSTPLDAIKDPKDASLAKLNDGSKPVNPLDPQSQVMADWQNMRQQWLQNRGAMQQAMLANALNPNGMPGGLDMDQRRAQWLANRQAMLDMAGLSGLNPGAMTREQRMLQMNLNRQSMADGIATGALNPMQMRAMMIQQWQLQRQGLLDQSAGINSPDFLAMRQQWWQNQLLMRNQMQDGTGSMMQQDMMRQMMLLRMADFLRNQTTTDQLAMGVSGRMYSELNRVRDAAGQAEGAGRVPLSELIGRRLENQQGNQLVSSLNLAPPSRLDSMLPSRADMQNLTNPGLLTSRPGFETLRPGVRPEVGGRPELANKNQKDNLQDSIRKAAESVIETAAGAKAAHDAAKRIEHRIDNVILGIRQNEVENLSTQQSAASRSNSEVANVANNSNTDAALLAAITARQLKEEKDLKERLLQSEKNKKKNDGKRRKIVVKEKDTLESICKRHLRDARLVPLIYEINAHILQAKARIKKNGEVQLVAGTILWLPSTTEIETFRGRLATGYTPELKSNENELTAEEELSERFGENWDGASRHDSRAENHANQKMVEHASEANQIRRQNIESLLGPLSKQNDTGLYYTCRLGDTLKSIAVKHPALKDPSLWKLIAEINQLATAVDSKGVPIAKIVRGSKIRIPNPDEVAEYLVEKRRISQSKADEFVSATTFPGSATTVVDPETPVEHKINSLKDAGALMLQAGGFKPRTKPLSEALTDPLTPTGLPTTYLSVTEFERSQAQLLENSKAIENVRALSDDCRVVRRHLAHFDGSRSFQAQLDVMVNGDWKVALVYNVSDTESWCQRFGQDGKVEKVKIQLPTSAIHQMLENDVNSNWQTYRDQMIG